MQNLKENDFYNGKFKIEYLTSFQEEQTAMLTSYLFKTAAKTEKLFKKDLADMNRDELGEVMNSFSTSTPNSAYVKCLQIEQYIDWAIDNGYVESSYNPLSDIDKKTWSAQFVAKYRQYAFTREDILDLSEKLENYMDRAVLLGIFEGIGGEGYSELLTLRVGDLNEKDDKFFAKLTNSDGEKRTIEISEELYHLLFKANGEEEYINKNGNVESGRWATSKLVESPYIMRKTGRGKQDAEKADLDYFFVNRKFQLFKKVFNMSFLKGRSVSNSGVMDMAHRIYQEKGELTEEDYAAIGDRYQTPYVMVNGKKERTTGVIKELLQSHFFEEMYGYKISK